MTPILYGTSWCGWTQRQLSEISSSPHAAKMKINYIQCDTDKNRMLCMKKNITSYPTWEFKKGVYSPGFKQLDDIKLNIGTVNKSQKRSPTKPKKTPTKPKKTTTKPKTTKPKTTKPKK